VTSKDPAAYTVVAEDSAALAGLAIAAAGIYCSHRFDMPQLDGLASILIGVLLAGVAILLIHQSRGLLVGEGVRPETADAIRRIVREEPGVLDSGPVLSMYIGPEEVLVTTSVVFADGTPSEVIAASIRRMEARIREQFPKVGRIYIEVVAGRRTATAARARGG
jgi:divalent metal cation (Fe/Co/Zn/Cd) transporter